jgi:TetR/AcrR family transcriptional repressor of nem operon
MGRTSDARQRLMDAAYALICEYSYGAVTIDAICERAQVKKGSFYYFFESKSDLAVTTINAWWSEREVVIERFFQSDIPPIERLRSYLDFVTDLQLSTYKTNGQILGCPLFTLGAEICTQDKRLCARIHEFLISVIATFTRAIADAQALGEIPGNNPEAKARAFFSMYEGILTLARIENSSESLQHLTQDVLEAIGVSDSSLTVPIPIISEPLSRLGP